MTSGRLLALRSLRRTAIAGAILASVVTGSLAAGKTPGQKKTPRTAAAQPRLDEAYSAKIKEYTTEPFFLTELVDHLPASDKVPSPEKVLGYVVELLTSSLIRGTCTDIIES